MIGGMALIMAVIALALGIANAVRTEVELSGIRVILKNVCVILSGVLRRGG